ncbi:MAG: D-glycero-beta-D-manno-heptose 1-phosphate adenylyltransferase [Sphingobacteriia bacterium]|nr:D-glycero-beta-D-manno-heptose 1-phosphate adenylyltransferase [Sphingobacteriia bacterium]
MKNINAINNKIYTLDKLAHLVNGLKMIGKTIAFTNGCFDIVHEGHIYSLSQAAKEADFLIVGVNADKSVKKLKGDDRPINNEHSRSLLLASIVLVDAVIVFEEDTPQQLIATLLPDVLVKGGDYTVEQIAGSKEVLANGGRVVINKIIEGFSTSGIIEHIRKTYS